MKCIFVGIFVAYCVAQNGMPLNVLCLVPSLSSHHMTTTTKQRKWNAMVLRRMDVPVSHRVSTHSANLSIAPSIVQKMMSSTSSLNEQSTGSSMGASTLAAASVSKKRKKQSQTLGLLTFDLDDTLYPIAPVLAEANRAFVRAMENFGYGNENIRPEDIVLIGRQIREEIAATGDFIGAASLTHTEVRRRAIRRAMESITLARKLQACADDWATPVASLSPIVVQHARKYVLSKKQKLSFFL
jgi:hypothetical protein